MTQYLHKNKIMSDVLGERLIVQLIKLMEKDEEDDVHNFINVVLLFEEKQNNTKKNLRFFENNFFDNVIFIGIKFGIIIYGWISTYQFIQ